MNAQNRWNLAAAAAAIAIAAEAPAGIECGFTPAGGLSVGPVIVTIGEPVVGQGVAVSGGFSAGFLGCLGVSPVPLLGDCNQDECVDGADLGIVLSEWGGCADGCTCDVNGDGVLDGEDLGILLSQWGACQ